MTREIIPITRLDTFLLYGIMGVDLVFTLFIERGSI
jgi:hypothetical protein